jgi:bacterioferritin-associated ferredoxin
MVICHCLAVNDRVISELAARRPVTVDDVVEMCGAGGECGGCRESIAWILERSLGTSSVRVASPA